MVDGKGLRDCQLCRLKPACLFCLADDAFLCWTCDASVHSANFLVARHSRSLLCHSCFSPVGCAGNGPQIFPNPISPPLPLPLFCSNCSSLQNNLGAGHDGNPSSSSSSSSTISFAASSLSCNGSAVNSCNRGRKWTLSISCQKDRKIECSEEEEDKQTTSGKENLGISDAQATSSTSTFHEDKKLGNKGRSVRCNLSMKAVSFKNKRPCLKYCKSSLSVSCQKYCKNRGSDEEEEEEEEEEKEATSTNGKLGISDTPSTTSSSKPTNEIHNKDTTSASKCQPYPSSGNSPRANGKSLNRTVGAVRSKHARC